MYSADARRFVAVRLWKGTSANGVTLLPVWVIEICGGLGLFGIVALSLERPEERVVDLGVVLAMIGVRRLIRKRVAGHDTGTAEFVDRRGMLD